MKRLPQLLLFSILTAMPAFAQSEPVQSPQSGPQNPAIKDPRQNASSLPVAGANSFTRGQAQSAIEAKGFTKVSGLRKDGQGIWRAKALKDGHSVSVSVDYQGNVN